MTHPLIEKVARDVRRRKFERTGRLSAFDETAQPSDNELDDAKAAIRAVLTFEPTYEMLLAVLHSDKWTDAKSSPEQRMDPVDAWETMTAALLREIDDGK